MKHAGRYVITGGPGVGKTTVINILAQRGYSTVSETARDIIEKRAVFRERETKEELFHFQELIAQEQLRAEDEVSEFPVFFDRGLVDGHAYCVLANVDVPKLITTHARGRYEKVFLFEPMDVYATDEIRTEGREEALRIHDQIKKSYEHFGYEPIEVPPLSFEERADFIAKSVHP